MKVISSLALFTATFWVGSLFTLSPSPAFAQNPKVSPPAIQEDLYSVAFPTPQLGWVVGTRGAILHTEDGGQAWKAQSSGTSELLRSVVFVTPQSGWAVGTGGTIVHTEDGGRTWKTQTTSTKVTLDSVAFATPLSGWATGSGTVVHTEDGQTWETQTIFLPARLHSVAFVTPQLGWAVGEHTIVHSEDGGKNWETRASGIQDSLYSVAFVTPQAGWAVGFRGAIAHTEDGGRTWKTQTSRTDACLNSVAFATPQSGWAAGGEGTIVHTEDGGTTWKKQASGTDAWLTSVAFATPQSGWAVGRRGVILHTVDGGQTWTKVSQAPPSSAPSKQETSGTVNPSSPENPKVKIGAIKENQRYKSSGGRFSVTVPAARNPFVRTYKFRESKLKHEIYDYEDVVLQIADLGQAYGAGVRRVPQSVLAQMAKEEPKQTLSNLADKALLQWRDYEEEPQAVDESSVQTQFGEGLFRVYLAKRSSLLVSGAGSGQAGKPKLEASDARIAVLVIKKGDWFIYATAEDEYMGMGSAPADLRKQLESFFASMTVKIQE